MYVIKKETTSALKRDKFSLDRRRSVVLKEHLFIMLLKNGFRLSRVLVYLLRMDGMAHLYIIYIVILNYIIIHYLLLFVQNSETMKQRL